LKIQQTAGTNYAVNASYNLAGAITSQKYPSGHIVTMAMTARAGQTVSLAVWVMIGTARMQPAFHIRRSEGSRKSNLALRHPSTTSCTTTCADNSSTFA